MTTPHGLHLSPISQIVREAGGFSCSMKLTFDGRTADAKSVYDLMMLAAPFGSDITITAIGTDAENAVKVIVELFERQFAVVPTPKAQP
ncbi:MAG: HPr family phosphocarrier protein [Planctomycetaceae bacterium]|nr:HPr family phosphocarrier protein [Planctomycetaceae bacterium]